MEFEKFVSDDTLTRAFARSLEIIGEAAKKGPEKTRVAYPEVEWKLVAGMRDKLIHHYFGIDYELVWDVVRNKVPALKKQIVGIIDAEPRRL